MSKDELVAAISAYKKSKQKKNSQRKCGACGYEYHEKKYVLHKAKRVVYVTNQTTLLRFVVLKRMRKKIP